MTYKYIKHSKDSMLWTALRNMNILILCMHLWHNKYWYKAGTPAILSLVTQGTWSGGAFVGDVRALALEHRRKPKLIWDWKTTLASHWWCLDWVPPATQCSFYSFFFDTSKQLLPYNLASYFTEMIHVSPLFSSSTNHLGNDNSHFKTEIQILSH